MSKLPWYWHRLRAMTPGEVALHARKKWRQHADARRGRDWGREALPPQGAFPQLPDPEKAPATLREALTRDVENILAGHWKAFGHLDLKVDDPPKWHCDYLVDRDLATTQSAFQLDHRVLPGGADIKLIWELSRWHQLVRLAMAAYVLGDGRAAGKCVDWLEDWVKHNPPYRGWNWTSALEVGLRLIQFTWIDALLGAPSPSSARSHAPDESKWRLALPPRLEALRQALLPPHVWYAWRHRSFGSSANNHLLGELAGLIGATARWPLLRKWGAPLAGLQRLWEGEVLAQFAEDGGNREQALSYQLFSWELCWQALLAIRAHGGKVSPPVEQRLNHAAAFEVSVQRDQDGWGYGDSDNAVAVPVFASESTVVAEWRGWMRNGPDPSAIRFWLGDPPVAQVNPTCTRRVQGWVSFQRTGIAVVESPGWSLRWDLSPLGYLRTAAHGHLDALHLSIWYRGVAMVVDPGTGAYYADAPLRSWLASRAAHNGPCPDGLDSPRRLGPFLWSAHHEPPALTECLDAMEGTLQIGSLQLGRRVSPSADGLSWIVQDSCQAPDGTAAAFSVRWQFAPGSWVKRISNRQFVVRRGEVSIGIEVTNGWTSVELVEVPETPGPGTFTVESMPGVVSPAFRAVGRAPCLKLVAAPAPTLPRSLHTTFSCGPSP